MNAAPPPINNQACHAETFLNGLPIAARTLATQPDGCAGRATGWGALAKLHDLALVESGIRGTPLSLEYLR